MEGLPLIDGIVLLRLQSLSSPPFTTLHSKKIGLRGAPGRGASVGKTANKKYVGWAPLVALVMDGSYKYRQQADHTAGSVNTRCKEGDVDANGVFVAVLVVVLIPS